MKCKYSGTIPFINLKFTCDWGDCSKFGEDMIPDSKNPIIIEFENCDSKIKLWKQKNKWNIGIIKSKRRRDGRTS